MIPKKIYQSWKTKELPKDAEENVKKLLELNPEYDYELSDDQDCKQFLLEHFGEEYALAFDIIKPGAFKCDYWRYAKLYVLGGVYLDMDLVPEVPFSEIIDEEDEFVSVADQWAFSVPKCTIYQAFLAVAPKHPVMYYSFIFSFSNIMTRRSDLFDLFSITGPVVVGQSLNMFWGYEDTHRNIISGLHPKNVKLYKMNLIPFSTTAGVYNLNGDLIFKNNKPETTQLPYGQMDYYDDDPRKWVRNFLKYVFIISLLIILILIFLWRRAKRECSK